MCLQWSPGHVRSLVVPNETASTIAPSLAACAKNVKCLQALATGVSAGSVELSTGASVEYDFLVVATGGRYSHPSAAIIKSFENSKTTQGRIAEIQAKASELSAAKTVLIVGGGPTGIEMACEIAQTYPQTKVTLASRGEIGQMLHQKVQKQVLARFKKLPNVTLASNTTVTPGAEGALASDVSFYTTGFVPNTEFLKGGVLGAALENNGLVKVSRDTMLVQEQTKVFAFGDITSPGLMEAPFNSGYVVGQESKKFAKNILNAIAGKPLKPMGKPPMQRGGLISLGKGHGTGHFDNMVLPQFIVAMMKSKDLFRKKVIKAASR